MSIFNQRIKQSIDEYKEELRPKDGRSHILLIATIVDYGKKQTKEYTSQINDFLDYMQENDYEILDIKLNINNNQSLAGYLHETLITYK